MFYFCFKLWSFKALVVISFNFQVSKKKKKKKDLNGFAIVMMLSHLDLSISRFDRSKHHTVAMHEFYIQDFFFFFFFPRKEPREEEALYLKKRDMFFTSSRHVNCQH
jgi:hypothetical protein